MEQKVVDHTNPLIASSQNWFETIWGYLDKSL